MKKNLFKGIMATLLMGALFVGCSSDSDTTESTSTDTTTQEESTSDETADGDMHKVVLITMDSTDQHWVRVDEGAQRAAEELGNIEYKWMAPDKKDDSQQIERVNNAVADGAEVIMIAANGPDAITAALQEAVDAGSKIIYVDSPANFESEATFATNNKEAGVLAGETLMSALEEQGVTEGTIGVVSVNTSTQSTVDREAGFREAFDGTGFEILETQYGEGDVAKSQDIADNYITQGVVGIFGANEGSTVGAGNAIAGSGGTVLGVGFDQSDSIMGLISDGTLVATMVQNPDVMGYEGMMAAEKVINGETIDPKDVDTGVTVVTADSME